MSAALGHILFGDFQLSITTSLLIGSIPGVWIGAQMSSRAPGGIIRRALAFVLLASALKLLGVPTPQTGAILIAVLCIAPPLWMVIRRRHGLPALASGMLRRGLYRQLGRPVPVSPKAAAKADAAQSAEPEVSVVGSTPDADAGVQGDSAPSSSTS
jgi:hypothetical protein